MSNSKAGHPPKFKTPEELQDKIDEYLKYIKEEKSFTTITGLALYLGFESRQSLYDYEKKEEYSYIIKRAKLFVELGYELSLREGSPTGAIFALKNMGWADKQEVIQETKQTGTLKIEIVEDKRD